MLIPMMVLALASGPAPDGDPVSQLLDVTLEPQSYRRYRPRRGDDNAFLALDETELSLRGGMLWFSEDFGADPEPAGGALLEVPMPWLGHGVFGLPRDGIGVFASFTASSMDRDYSPPVLEPSGDLMFFNTGLSLSLLRNDTWLARIYGGYQYADYGDVSDMRDGSAGLVGAGLGVGITGGLKLTWTGELIFARDGDQLIFNYAGLLLEF